MEFFYIIGSNTQITQLDIYRRFRELFASGVM